MELDRPDLSQTDPDIVAYIEALEAELERVQGQPGAAASPEIPLEPDEPPTTLNVITITGSGLAKRTPRHLYSRQRRGGMGIFDLDAPDHDPPGQLIIADEASNIIVITSQARVFRLAVATLPEAAIRSRGQSLLAGLPLEAGETLAIVVPHQSSGYLNVVTNTGQIRRLRHHFFGDNMIPGNLLYDARSLGRPAAATWSGGNGDIFIATRQGKAIRFAEDAIPFKGCLGLRLSDDDAIMGVVGVQESSGVFLLTADGKGTIRLMSGFGANKAPGGGGKVAIKADNVIAALAIAEQDDLFIISRLCKIIRFQAAEIPPKEGVVQGVNCMALRADETVAAVRGVL